MAISIVSTEFKHYNQALFVRNFSGTSVQLVSFYSVDPELKSSDWVTLVDLDNVEEITDSEKMVLIDCVKLPLLNSLAAISSDKLVVAVLCVCRHVTEKELRMNPEELTSEDYPPILFLLEKNNDVVNIKQLLLFNPREVECSIQWGQSDVVFSPLDPHAVRKPSYVSGYATGYEVCQDSGKSKMRYSTIQDTLDNILFTKMKEDDILPLTLCTNPELINLIINFIHQKVDSHSHDKKESLRNTMNKFVKYLKSKVIFENRIQVDWPIYLIILSEIGQLYDGSKDNLAHEAIEYILSRFLKSHTSTIVTSIQRFSELVQDRAIKLKRIESPVNELINLFTIEYTQCHKPGNKYNHMKPITKLQDLKNKLMWYSVLMLCNQSFNIPDHSKWNECFIRYIEHDQLSIYDSSNLNAIWESGIHFGLKLGLSLEQRFLLSHVMKLVSTNYNNYTFQNFNTVLDYILKFQYEYLEISDFCHQYYLFLHQYSTSTKKQLKLLLDDNPKACVETMCLTLSKLSTLICTATGVVKEFTNPYDALKKSWFDIFSLLLNNVVCYYHYEAHNPRDCAIVLRLFYDAIKIPSVPEEIVKPWINEYKKQVVSMITTKFHVIDIETFHEILGRFSVTVLSKTAIYDYFAKYEPPQGTSLKDGVWKELLIVIFKIRDPPKSIFLSLHKISTQYLRRDCGFEFICDCLEMDLPAYGLEYNTTKEDTMIINFKNYIEQQCRILFIRKLHNSLIQILIYIPKLRLPSLLQAIMMDALIHAIVPEPSLLVHGSQDGYCKQLILSLQTLSYQKDCTTYEQLKISYQHSYLWKILALISRKIIFKELEWSNFPYMVTALMFVYNKYCENVTGFQGCAWKDRNLVSFIEFCKKSGDIITKQYQNILNNDYSLLEYTDILNNLTNLNELFKNCNLEILSKEIIQAKIQTFTDTANGLTSTLFLQIQIENIGVKSCFILAFLNEQQVEVSVGIRMEIESLIKICYKQVTGRNEQMYQIPVLEPNDTIKLNEFQSRCKEIIETFGMFTSPIFQGSDYSVHKFLSHFSLRENQLFDACLRKCMVDKFQQIPDRQYFSKEELVKCSIHCFELLNRICQGVATYADIEYINEHLTLQSLDFDKIQTDMKLFPPLADQIKGNLGVLNLFQLLKISEYLVYVTNVCKQYKLLSCIASPEFSQLENIYSKLSDKDSRNKLTITQGTELLEQVNQITSDMPIQRYQLFPILEESVEFYRFLLDKNLHNSRDSFDIQVNVITSERQDEDYEDTVLTHLSIAYNYMIPLFDQKQTLSGFLKNYSLMKIGSETGYSQLRTVNNNITLIRRWFIIAGNQFELPEGIRIQVESLINICSKQFTSQNEQMCLIPVLEPLKDTVKFKEFKSRCADITETFGMFTSPIFERSDRSVQIFLAHFSFKENLLFDACLRKCLNTKLELGSELLSLNEFIDCSTSCYEILNKICGANPSLIVVEYIWRIFKLHDIHQTRAHICLAIRNRNIILNALFHLPCNCKESNMSDSVFYPYSITKLRDHISVLCKSYNKTIRGRKIYYPIESGFEPEIPENMFQAIQFLSLFRRIFPSDILDMTHTSTTLTSILTIYSEIYRYLKIGEGENFFSNNLPICFEILDFQNTLNCFLQTNSLALSKYPNVDIFHNSYSQMKKQFFVIIELCFSKELNCSQLHILIEYLEVINICLNLYSGLDPIQIESINSQIHQFEISKSHINNLLFFNPELSPEGRSDNSLLEFMKYFLVCIPKQLQDCVDLVLSENNNITLKQLTQSCDCIKEELVMISEDIFEFLSFFVTRKNILFLSLLRHKTSMNRSRHLTEGQLDISQFVEYIHETYQQIHSMCIGDYTFTQVQHIPGISFIHSNDLSVIVKDISQFPTFSTLLIDGFPSLCLFELHLVSCYLPSIVKLCEDFDMRVCMNSLQFKSLHRHFRNLSDLHYCEGVTISKGNQLLRDINRLINCMTISRLKLFDTLSKCREILLLFNKLDLKEGRISLQNIQSNILSDSKLSEHHSLVSDNLLPVYDLFCPLFDEKINFTQLMLAYSNLHIPDEEDTSLKLERFLSSINVFRSLL